jgi:hypothetical protein
LYRAGRRGAGRRSARPRHLHCTADRRCCGLRGAGLTVTCDNGAAFGWLAEGGCDGEEVSGGVDGACCTGAAGCDGVASEGAVGVCSVDGAAWARTSFAPAAASAR